MDRKDIVKNIVSESLLLEKKKRRPKGAIRSEVENIFVRQPLQKFKELAIAPDKAYGMGGNEPAFGEYSGPVSKPV